MQPKNTLSQKFIIDTSNFGANHNVMPHTLLKMFQDIATIHAKQIGFGWQDLGDAGFIFVASKTVIKLNRPLNKEEVVTIKTIPITSERFVAERDYLVFDENKNCLVEGNSQWCLINAQNRRLASIDNVNQLLKVKTTKKSLVPHVFEKITYTEDFKKEYDFKVTNSSVDVNAHFNNVEYSRLAIDCLSESNLEKGIKEFEIHYNAEVKLNEILKVYKKQTSDNQIMVVGLRSDDKQVFATKIKLF